MSDKKKLFICHASEDKNDFVRPLAEALKQEFDVWYDEYRLIIGMSLLSEINKGLANCDFGVVVLSPSFFLRNWTQNELDGLFALEEKERKVILPIWKDIDFEAIKKSSPILAGRIAAKANEGVNKVIENIKKSIEYFDRGRFVERPTEGLNKIRSVLQKRSEQTRSADIVASSLGVDIGYKAAHKTISILTDNVKSLIAQGGYKGLRAGDKKDDGMNCSVSINLIRKYLYSGYHNNVINSANRARLTMKIGESGETSQEYNSYLENYYALYVDSNDNPFWINKDEDKLLSPEVIVDYWFGKFAEFIEIE